MDSINILLTYTNTQDILTDMRGIIETARESAYQAVNVALVKRNWLLGRRIAEEELNGGNRAEYGLEIIKTLSKSLIAEHDKGFESEWLCLRKKPWTAIISATHGLMHALDFFHRSLCQYIHHNLCAEFECVTEGFAIGQHIDLSLGGHVILKLLLLLFREGADERIPGFNNFVQRSGILAVLLKAALAGLNVSQIEIFQHLHLNPSFSSK